MLKSLVKYMKCYNCGTEYSFDLKNFRCTKCNEPLEIEYNYEEISGKISRNTFARDFTTPP